MSTYSLTGSTSVVDGSAAVAGKIGEIKQVNISTAVGAAFTLSQFGNIGSLELTPGDWIITALGSQTFTALLTGWELAISEYSGNTATDHLRNDNLTSGFLGISGVIPGSSCIPHWNISKSVSTTVYLKGKIFGALGDCLTGKLIARRIR